MYYVIICLILTYSLQKQDMLIVGVSSKLSIAFLFNIFIQTRLNRKIIQ